MTLLKFYNTIKKYRYTPTHKGNTKGWYANEEETLAGDSSQTRLHIRAL
jgi:hypothetical protein